jgi:hypothetical protein
MSELGLGCLARRPADRSHKGTIPGVHIFLVLDMNGRSFCDSSSEHTPITVIGRPTSPAFWTTETFTIGEFAIGRATGRNSAHFALPFYGDDGHVDGVAIAALRLDWLADYIGKRGVPAGAALAIPDRNGQRTPDVRRRCTRRVGYRRC